MQYQPLEGTKKPGKKPDEAYRSEEHIGEKRPQNPYS